MFKWFWTTFSFGAPELSLELHDTAFQVHQKLFKIIVYFRLATTTTTATRRAKKQSVQTVKQDWLCARITLFCTLLCRHCTTTTWKYKWTPEKFANIWRIKRDKISSIMFEAAWIHFLNAVFVAIALVCCSLMTCVPLKEFYCSFFFLGRCSILDTQVVQQRKSSTRSKLFAWVVFLSVTNCQNKDSEPVQSYKEQRSNLISWCTPR